MIQFHGMPIHVTITTGEFAGLSGVVIGTIAKRYTKEPTVHRVQIDGFPKPGGWNGLVYLQPDAMQNKDTGQ